MYRGEPSRPIESLNEKLYFLLSPGRPSSLFKNSKVVPDFRLVAMSERSLILSKLYFSAVSCSTAKV